MKKLYRLIVMPSLAALLLSSCGGGGSSTPPATTDTTAPVITLNGANPMAIVQGSVFTDPGSVVTDNVDTGLIATVTGTVTVGTVGTYTLTYNVSDAAGNAAAATRTVNVADTTAPTITLNGTATAYVIFLSTYVDAGATANDAVDGDITASIVVNNAVNTSVLGSYQVSYDVSDAAANAAVQVLRTVNVVKMPLNDTGFTTWGDASANNLTVTQAAFPGQDADFGRDTQVATLVKIGGGTAGFDFTKLNAAGVALTNR